MKQTSFVKRCLAFALALVLLVSQSGIGLVQTVHAANNSVSTTIAQIIADNYDLSEAEKDLLESGYLVSDPYTYTAPSNEDDLVSVDTENKKISADEINGFTPVKALVVVGNETKEEVALTDGEGTYAYTGNAFSVKVVYELTTDVDASVQEALLGAAAILKQGVANLESVKGQSEQLAILELAMPELVELAENGVETSFTTVQLNCKDAISALNDQMAANSGKLLLNSMIEEYENGTKTGYLMTKAAEMQTEIADLVTKVTAISADLNTIYNNIEWLIEQGLVDETLAKQIKTLANNCSKLAEGLATVNADPWAAANGAVALTETVDFAKLDALVAALGETTAVTVVETLKVTEATVQVNMAMWNVTYKAVLKYVDNNELVEGFSAEKVVTLADGASAEAVLAELNEMVENLKASEYFVEGKFEKTLTEVPAELKADLTVEIVYTPKNFTVTIAGEAKEYPYGYELTLPVHENSEMSYDYTDADGNYYAQGTVVVVEDDMTFARAEGKAYTNGKLYAIIADNYGTEKIAAILNSGAIKGNDAVNYREPSKAELEELVKLDGNVLTVKSYDSAYAGLTWAPYSYVVDGSEKLFNGASEVTIAGDFEKVAVYYRLTLTNYSEAEVKEILDLAAELVAEAEAQKAVMDNLVAYKEDMSQLNKNMLNGLNGMIGGYAVSEGGKFSDALVASMKAIITDIITNAVASNGSLKINGIIESYLDENNGGLAYYYQNAENVKYEISYLSEKLAALLGDPQGKDLLATLLNDMSYSHYVEKLDDLNAKMAQIDADLKPVNAKVDTTNAAKVAALTAALAMEGSVDVAECGSPYVEMGPVNRIADKYAAAEVKVTVNGKSATFTTDAILKGQALTKAQINDLTEAIYGFVTENVDPEFYNNDYNNGSELYALVGVALDKNVSFEYTWTAKEYTVKIEGVAGEQIVTINDLTIDLPAHEHEQFGLSYEYTIGTKTANSGIYTFTKDELRTLFVNGALTITRIEKNANVEALEKMVSNINIDLGFEALELVAENGLYTGINANITAGDMMKLMMGLVMKSGYGYIGLNNEGFIYANEQEELELSMQTLINAILNDETFNNNTVIALGENGKGKVLTASMQLGANASELTYTDLTFNLNLTSVPAELVTYIDYIKLISKVITFQSNNGVMDVKINLPDQAYAAYAAALVATGNVAKDEVNELTQKVPVQFLYDYLTAITGSEMDLETFTNTLEMLGIDRDLTAYNNYYVKGLAAYNKYIDITIDDEKTSVGVEVPGKQSINGLLKLLGIDMGSLSQFMGMLKEYKDGNFISFNATGVLSNVDKTYYALIIDAQADGLRNKVEAPSSYAALANETANLAGYSAMILTADVPGDLTIAGTTILDLNGFNVAGTINATGKLFIMDSTMGNTAGTVNNVTGNASILAGCYESDVSSKLVSGCYLEDGMVRNALYQIVEDEDGNLTIVLDGNYFQNVQAAGYLPDAKAMAVNMVTDLLLNYANTAKIALGGYELVAADFDDLVGLYASDNRIAELAKKLIACFTIGEKGYENNAGFEGVVNMVLADLLDFEAITNALNNNTALATYELTTAPWTIEIDHNTEKDYATLDVRYNAKLEKTINVSLVVESKYNDNVAAMTEVLSEIVVKDETYAMVDIPTPTYSDKTLTVSGAGKASLVMDMSADNKYAIALGVILAYGNPDKAEAVAAAIDANDMTALKAVVDNTSVKEIFTALKKLNRATDFAAMAEKVGVTVDTATAAELEAKFHLVFCAAGKVLEELDITGMNSKLGALYNEETGYYELSKTDIFRDKEFNVRSYSAVVELEATELTLKVKLFGEDCLWGDANHDGIVDTDDATLVELYAVGKAPECFCTLRTDVNADGLIDTDDAALIRMYAVESITVFPAENK